MILIIKVLVKTTDLQDWGDRISRILLKQVEIGNQNWGLCVIIFNKGFTFRRL